MYFAPHHPDSDARRCRYCRYFTCKMAAPDVWCGKHEFVSAGGMGCASFEREPGADDE